MKMLENTEGTIRYEFYTTPIRRSNVDDTIDGIEAVDGKEAIEYVKKHVIGVYKFQCFHDDDDDINLAREVAFAEVMD